MGDAVDERDTAIEIAEDYAAEECVGTLGEILDVRREGSDWIVEFRTHTFADAFEHRVRMTASMGNIISHERNDRLE